MAENDVPAAVVRQRARISLVWLVPVVAALVGGWLAYRAASERGPRVTITFTSAEGLEEGKTKVKYKDLELGVVESIELTENLSHVIVTAQLVAGTEPYLRENTRFWVMRARVSAGRVTGLGTLFSGAYIGMDPALEGGRRSSFTGLENPPLVTSRESGRRFVLHAEQLGSLDIGSPVYFRQAPVGQVVRTRLIPAEERVAVDIFVRAPFDELVRGGTQFWNASGFDVSLDATGVRIDTESVVSMLIGGVAFETPALDRGPRAEAGAAFPLYPSRRATAVRVYTVKQRYLLHFEGSVRGLAPGAPVEFRGIRVGEVVDIRLEYDTAAEELRIPVVVEIEPERIAISGEGGLDVAERFTRLVGRGLRAQLKSANLLTGQLLVDLDLHDDAAPARVRVGGVYPQLPTIPTPLEEITANLTRLVGRLGKLPLDAMGEDLRATLERTRILADQLDAALLPALTEAIAQARETLRSADTMLRPDAPVSRELRRLLIELADAARSVRLLADQLEQHPEEFLRGKGGAQ